MFYRLSLIALHDHTWTLFPAVRYFFLKSIKIVFGVPRKVVNLTQLPLSAD